MTRIARFVVLPALILAGACDESTTDGDPSCDLGALLPGLDNVPSALRPDGVAEVLALRCGTDIAADPELFASLHADLVRIYAADSRMQIGGVAIDVGTFSLSDPLSVPPSLSAWDAAVENATALLDPDTCGARIVAALGGEVTDARSAVGSRFIRVEFPVRLDLTVLLAAFAANDIALQSNTMTGDGSDLQWREVAGGRDYWFTLGGGDCPAGCSSHHHFLWRVTATEVTLFAEWGIDFANGQTFGTEPAGLDPTSFHCP